MHTAVLLHQLVDNIFTRPDGIYLDCTGGGGSHSALLYERLSSDGRLIILDRDIDAVDRLTKRFKDKKNIQIVHSNFSEIIDIMATLEIDKFTAIFADFGTSAYQLKDEDRGFSFRLNGEIDMRMDRSIDTITAKDIVNTFEYDDLTRIIFDYSQEQFAKRIARAIIERRQEKLFTDTLDLSEVINNAIPKKFHKKGFNPSTKTFQSLRIFVNDELKAIETLLKVIPDIIEKGGRFAGISFHELEDRLVKQALVEYAKTCVCPPSFPICVCGKKKLFSIITKKPIIPDIDEVNDNPLSRSARLRVGERV